MDVTTMALQLASGAVGGHLAGTYGRQNGAGIVGNLVSGAVGGGLGSQLAHAATGLGAAAVASGDIGAIVAQAIGGVVGGGALTLFVGWIAKALAR